MIWDSQDGCQELENEGELYKSMEDDDCGEHGPVEGGEGLERINMAIWHTWMIK